MGGRIQHRRGPLGSPGSPRNHRLGERGTSPSQPRDHPQILGIPYVLEMTVGRAVEFSKHQCLSPRISGAHTAEHRCRNTDSGVTTGIEVCIRYVRLEPPRWLVQVSVRKKRVRSIGRPNAIGALLEKCFGNLPPAPFCRLRYHIAINISFRTDCHWLRARCEWERCEAGIVS